MLPRNLAHPITHNQTIVNQLIQNHNILLQQNRTQKRKILAEFHKRAEGRLWTRARKNSNESASGELPERRRDPVLPRCG